MCLCNAFNAVGDELTCYEGILHSFMSHGDTVTDTDGREFDRSSACHAYTGLYGFCNAVKFNVTWNKFVLCADDTNHRLVKFFISVS